PFSTRFDYDGTSNLLVDLSWHNPAAPGGVAGNCLASVLADPQRIVATTSLSAGVDPLTLPNNSSNGRVYRNKLLNLRFTTTSNVAMQPAAAAPFVNGVWNGNLSIAGPGATVSVRAMDAAGHFGDSSEFTVNSTDTD